MPKNDLASRTGQVLRPGPLHLPAQAGRHPAVFGGGIGRARVPTPDRGRPVGWDQATRRSGSDFSSVAASSPGLRVRPEKNPKISCQKYAAPPIIRPVTVPRSPAPQPRSTPNGRPAGPTPSALHDDRITPALPAGSMTGSASREMELPNGQVRPCLPRAPSSSRLGTVMQCRKSDMEQGINESVERLDELPVRLVPVS